jgi:hypothetical protein
MERLSMNKFFLLTLIVISCLSFYPKKSVAASLEENEKALKMIADFADRLCKEIPLQGHGDNLELTGSAKAELNGIIKKLANLGLDGAIKYQNTEYEGLLQKDLVSALKDETKCRLQVWNDLKDKLISNTATTIDQGKARWRSKRGTWSFDSKPFFAVGEKDFNKAYRSDRNFSNVIYEVRLRKTSNNDGPFGLLVRYNEMDDEGYMLLLWPLQGKYQFSRIVGEQRHRIAGGSSASLKKGINWNTIKITAEGSDFNISINSRDTISVTNDYYHYGKIGLVIHGVSKNRAEFDVRKVEPM